jgi:hypothetical protein
VIRPRLRLVVSATPDAGSPGDTVTYAYVVRNVGDVSLRDITVSDDRLGVIGTVAALQPGHAVTLHATRVLSASGVWVTNTATAVADDPSGAAVRATDAASISIVAASANATGPGGANSGTSDGTAFTGTDLRSATIGLIALAVLGVCMLALARREA